MTSPPPLTTRKLFELWCQAAARLGSPLSTTLDDLPEPSLTHWVEFAFLVRNYTRGEPDAIVHKEAGSLNGGSSSRLETS